MKEKREALSSKGMRGSSLSPSLSSAPSLFLALSSSLCSGPGEKEGLAGSSSVETVQALRNQWPASPTIDWLRNSEGLDLIMVQLMDPSPPTV